MVKVLKQNYKKPSHFTEASWMNSRECRGFKIILPDPIDPRFPTPVVRLEFDVVNDYFRVAAMRVVSERLRRELEKITSDEIEYFDVKLQNVDGATHKEQRFYFAHLTQVVDCFDYDRSDYDRADDGYIELIRKLVLREDVISNSQVFWVANTSSLPFWMVSDEFAAHMEATDLTGMLFLNLDEVKMFS